MGFFKKPFSYFCYVQDTWNTYNLIHWDINLSRTQLLYLKAQHCSQDGIEILGEQFSVKTKTSIWDE